MTNKYHKPEAKVIQELKDIAHKFRIDSICATNASNSGHPTSCSSIAEVMSVLFFHTMRYDLRSPRDASHDRLILSKGHAAPILYAAWAEAGLFPVCELNNLRKIDSDLEGYPTPRLNFVDVGTGSLGQGLSVACGMAYVGKYFDKASYRTYCIMGDGEQSAEGSVWEALNFASFHKLDNLVAIFDINRLGQSNPTMLQHCVDVYRKRVEIFGFHALAVDGHDVEELCKAFFEASVTKGKPTAIICKTLKGKYFPNIEDQLDWHGKPLGKEAEAIIKHLKTFIRNHGAINVQRPAIEAPFPPALPTAHTRLSEPPAYKKGEKVTTRLAYGTSLVKIAANNTRVIALDGDMKNSTLSKMLKAFPDRYIECFDGEQNLVGVATGAACRKRTIPFVSTFDAFFTRAFDHIRMGAVLQANVKFVGSHCGISIGRDGPSHMALEDLAMFRAIPESHVFYPSDAVSTERAVELAANIEGICFIRTSRPAFSILYSNDEPFAVGQGKIVKSSNNDKVLIIGAGVTLHEAIEAANELQSKHNIGVRVIDPFTIKPLDEQLIIKNAQQCGGKILTVEDHYAEGGLGEAVMSAVAEVPDIVVKKLAVRKVPRSGPSNVLLDMFGISSKNIVKNVKNMI